MMYKRRGRWQALNEELLGEMRQIWVMTFLEGELIHSSEFCTLLYNRVWSLINVI
jgi:hypothetical protein